MEEGGSIEGGSRSEAGRVEHEIHVGAVIVRRSHSREQICEAARQPEAARLMRGGRDEGRREGAAGGRGGEGEAVVVLVVGAAALCLHLEAGLQAEEELPVWRRLILLRLTR